jgi:cell division protein YceG involved in septum cleavage
LIKIPQLFLINPDGTTTEITSEGPIKDVLKTDECYVLVADNVRKVYLWKGVKSSVRSKFIGAKRSQEIRGQVGMHYAVVPIDEGEEEPEFIKLIGGQTEAGVAKEIRAAEVSAPNVHPLREKNIFGTPEPAEGMNIAGSKERALQNTGPLYRGDSSMTEFVQEQSQVDFQQIMQKLEEIQIPNGFERELIIIGNQAYSIVEKVQQFLGEKQVTKEISKVGAIPEGIFFAEDYSPRILSENGKIIAIEFLKRVSGKSKPVEIKSKRELLKEQIKEQLGGN